MMKNGRIRCGLIIFIINKELSFIKKELQEDKNLQLERIEEYKDSSSQQT